LAVSHEYFIAFQNEVVINQQTNPIEESRKRRQYWIEHIPTTIRRGGFKKRQRRQAKKFPQVQNICTETLPNFSNRDGNAQTKPSHP
jgi:hypothetical protein